MKPTKNTRIKYKSSWTVFGMASQALKRKGLITWSDTKTYFYRALHLITLTNNIKMQNVGILNFNPTPGERF